MKKTWSLSISALCLCLSAVLVGCEKQQEVSEVAPKPLDPQVSAVLERVTQGRVKNISTIKVTDQEPEWFEVNVIDGQAEVLANSHTALAYGAYQ